MSKVSCQLPLTDLIRSLDLTDRQTNKEMPLRKYLFRNIISKINKYFYLFISVGNKCYDSSILNQIKLSKRCSEILEEQISS